MEGAVIVAVGQISPLKIYVHLPFGHDAIDWKRRWESGELVGINDPSPYGYSRAERMGCVVTFSKAGPESLVSKLMRGGLRVLLGFDYLHARRNADRIYESDAVWTHTESQFLAIAALFSTKAREERPRLLGQSVWLIDSWRTLTWLHRYIYRRLISYVDIMTFHSPINYAEAQRLFPATPSALVLFGVPSESPMPVRVRNTNPIRIISVGNDRHRDWKTLINALGGQEGIELTIVSGTADQSLASGYDNVEIRRVKQNSELKALVDSSTLMVVPLKSNKHASGITVIQEAVLQGLPVIASDVGGLEAYFSAEEITYVPEGNPTAMLTAVRELSGNPRKMSDLAEAALRKMLSGELGCEAYISRHVELTRAMLYGDNRSRDASIRQSQEAS